MKKILLGFAVGYLLTGIMFGIGMYRAIPAINVQGAVYYGAVWPAWPLSVIFNTEIAPIPEWAFSFDD